MNTCFQVGDMIKTTGRSCHIFSDKGSDDFLDGAAWEIDDGSLAIVIHVDRTSVSVTMTDHAILIMVLGERCSVGWTWARLWECA